MKGEVRSPMQVWLFALLTCGLYGLYWWYLVATELKQYLERDDINPTNDLIIGFLCGIYMLYLPIKYGKLIQEAQVKAGIANAEDPGMKILLMMFVCSYGYAVGQEEMNKIWNPNGAPEAAA